MRINGMAGSKSTLTTKLLTVASLFVICAGLHFGSALFVPLALAVLFSLILSPLVNVGERLKLPRAISVVTVVILVFGVLGLSGFFVVGQAATLGKELPKYKANAQAKLQALRAPFQSTMGKIREAVQGAKKATEAPPVEAVRPDGQQVPAKVEVVEDTFDPIDVATVVMGSIVAAGGSFAVVLLLVIFFLIYKTEIRDRVLRLAGDAQVNVTVKTITEATRGVSRFLFIQAIVNTSYGVLLGAGLFLLGVPGALLWGFLAAVLRFVPYLGPVAAGVLPVLLALGVFPGWTRPLMTAGFIISLEIVVNNFVEPVAYGKRTGISPFAVVLAAVFWAWMWGVTGLILAVPLTVCLLSVGKYVPSLRFLTVALGDDPAPRVTLQVYHRLLSRHQEGAAELLERERAGGKSLAEFYDGVVLPVARMVEADVQEGKVDEEKAASLLDSLREIVDDLADSSLLGRDNGVTPVPREHPGLSVLCLPLSHQVDDLLARMLAQVFSSGGCHAKALGVGTPAEETVEAVRAEGADVLVICSFPPSKLLRARNLYVRLRRSFSDVPILVAVMSGEEAREQGGRIAPDGKAMIVSTFVDVEKAIDEISKRSRAPKPAVG